MAFLGQKICKLSPYFNSFLKGVYGLTLKLGGTIEVIERDKNKTTDEGFILLDGQLIFQGDIDSGKIKLPD